MMVKDEVLRQIDSILTAFKDSRSLSKWDDLSDRPEAHITSLTTTMCETINRFAPRTRVYRDSMEALIKRYSVTNSYIVPHIAGILDSLRSAYASGYLTTVTELIHADLFSDFIDMADYLLTEGYKDPAAVIIGSVLEEHLRQLAHNNGISIDVGGKPKKTDQLNSELAAQAIYPKLDQKSITGWLDLRNKAAHGKYSEYTLEQVRLLLQGTRDFIARVPA